MGYLTLRAYRGGIASMATLIPAIGTSADKLHAELRTLIANSRPRVAASFPDAAIVSTLSTQFGLSHMVAIVALETSQAGQFYVRRVPFASSCVPSPATNRWGFCKYTKTASPWPSNGPKCLLKRSWSKSCMRLCWMRANGWRDVGCCWGTWMMSDDVTAIAGVVLYVGDAGYGRVGGWGARGVLSG